MTKKAEFIGLRGCPQCNEDMWEYNGESVGPFPYKCKCNAVTTRVITMKLEAKMKEKPDADNGKIGSKSITRSV